MSRSLHHAVTLRTHSMKLQRTWLTQQLWTCEIYTLTHPREDRHCEREHNIMSIARAWTQTVRTRGEFTNHRTSTYLYLFINSVLLIYDTCYNSVSIIRYSSGSYSSSFLQSLLILLFAGRSRGRVQGVHTPPQDEAFFVFAFKIC